MGRLGGDLLVGNFGDGAITAHDPVNGASAGELRNPDGNPIRIDGLWALRFGNGMFGTPRSYLCSRAGIADEAHGLFGELLPAR